MLVPAQFFQALLPAALGAPQFTVPAFVGYASQLSEIHLSNTSSSAVNVTVYVAPPPAAGQNPGAASQMVPAISVPANGIVQIQTALALAPGWLVSAFASVANVVSCTVSGFANQ